MNGTINLNRQNNLSVFEHYLQKHSFQDDWIRENPDKDLFLSIVIPCCNEPEILKALESLRQCEPAVFPAEIIVVVNHSQSAPAEIKALNLKTYHEISAWSASASVSEKRFYAIAAFDMPEKDAGVGLARKTGMDEAVRRFRRCGNRNGVIAGFDADCTCSVNYLKEIEKAFINPVQNAASLYFEHPLKGNDYDPLVYKHIRQYELHLRYYKNALKYAGFPFAFHTIGSSFAVRASSYCRQGGMNKRKAGEDFYFLSKVIPTGNYGEINSACVFPSPRPSDRVPFGTGAAIGKMLMTKQDQYVTYPFSLFEMLHSFFMNAAKMYRQKEIVLPGDLLGDYCRMNQMVMNFENVKNNTASETAFVKRFFTVFNAFRILKFLNFAVTNGCEMKPVSEECRILFEKCGIPENGNDYIELLRRWDRGESLLH
jgi:glycosyltransferase involved in cell wall biosynthesis